MNPYLINRKTLLILFSLFSALQISFSAYAASSGGLGFDITERSVDKEMFQESFKVQEEQILPYFDIPEADLSKVESPQQVKNNYKNVLTLVLQKKIPQATTKVDALIQDNPDQSIYYNLKALLKLIDNDLPAAKQSFQTAIKLNKYNTQAYAGLAQIALQEKQLKQAKQYANQALAINPRSTSAYQILATITLQEKGIDATETLLLDANQKVRGNLTDELKILNDLRRIYSAKKQPEKLLPLATDLVARYPDEAPALSYLAGAQLLNNDDKGTEKTLRQLIALQPSNGNYRYFLARVLGKQKGKETEILIQLDKAAVSADNPALILSYKTLILSRQKRYTEALAVAQLVDESNPELSLGKILKGDIYFAEKKYPEALQNYQRAYQKKPSTQTLDKILKTMLVQNKRNDASRFLQQELEKNPDNTLIQLRLASLYQSSKQYDLAIKHYESVLANQPDNLIVLNNLAWLYSQQNNPKALELAQQAYTKAPKSAAIADTYGYILLKNGKANESLTVLKHAAQLAPEIAEIQLHLAEAYIATQQKSQAKEILQLIISEQGKEATAARKLMQKI